MIVESHLAEKHGSLACRSRLQMSVLFKELGHGLRPECEVACTVRP